MSVPRASLTFPQGHSVKSLDFPVGLFINGEFVAGEGGKTIEVKAPSTGKVIAHVAEASVNDVDRAVDAAQKAYDTVWGERCPGHQRGKLLMKLADLIEEHKAELASVEALDNGKPYSMAYNGDISLAANCLRYYGGWADKEHGKVVEVDDSKLAITKHEPIGVVGQIIPWNFPFLMLAWKIGPALAMGNTVVMKTAETTPLSAFYACQLFAKVLPPGVLNILTGYGHVVGAAISSHMKILKVAFTGSTLVGRQIMKAAAQSNLKPVTLELGGKSPNIVFDDADLDQAASWGAFGLFFNAGQCCAAGSRLFVQESIYDRFLEKLTARVKSLPVGDPFAPNSFLGPATSEMQFDRISAHIQAGKDEGATLHLGGGRHGTQGYFLQPTIFTDVTPNMKIAQEEIFGPVLVVQKFKDEDDLVAKANDTIYGLASAVFSRDISRCLRIANKLQAGTVWINNWKLLSLRARCTTMLTLDFARPRHLPVPSSATSATQTTSLKRRCPSAGTSNLASVASSANMHCTITRQSRPSTSTSRLPTHSRRLQRSRLLHLASYRTCRSFARKRLCHACSLPSPHQLTSGDHHAMNCDSRL